MNLTRDIGKFADSLILLAASCRLANMLERGASHGRDSRSHPDEAGRCNARQRSLPSIWMSSADLTLEFPASIECHRGIPAGVRGSSRGLRRACQTHHPFVTKRLGAELQELGPNLAQNPSCVTPNSRDSGREQGEASPVKSSNSTGEASEP
jgi:hypothetical protein